MLQNDNVMTQINWYSFKCRIDIRGKGAKASSYKKKNSVVFLHRNENCIDYKYNPWIVCKNVL